MRSIVFSVLIILAGCTQDAKKQISSIPLREYSVQSVLWQQRSSEYEALCHQSFNMARFYLNILIDKHQDSVKPLAIITDIDETVLDNSPFNARMIELDVEYSREGWTEWGRKEEANAVPGALDFFTYAHSRNVKIFYISNRNTDQLNETLSNLKQLGFPDPEDEHILLKDSTSKKQPRRDIVLNSHNVIMYLGDNLSDFSGVFDGLDRNLYVDSLRSKFGFEFIVLPNPMYGDWETKEIYEGRYDWTSFEKDSIRKAKLISY